jgi:hypothetical protein
MGVIEVAEPEILVPSQSEGRLHRPKPRPLVAGGVSGGSKISLYKLCFNSMPLASVFIYPSTCALNALLIYELDGVFSNATRLGDARVFRDRTMDELDKSFLKSIGSEPPLTTQRYSNRIPVIHHGFPVDLKDFLQGKINGLRA